MGRLMRPGVDDETRSEMVRRLGAALDPGRAYLMGRRAESRMGGPGWTEDDISQGESVRKDLAKGILAAAMGQAMQGPSQALGLATEELGRRRQSEMLRTQQEREDAQRDEDWQRRRGLVGEEWQREDAQRKAAQERENAQRTEQRGWEETDQAANRAHQRQMFELEHDPGREAQARVREHMATQAVESGRPQEAMKILQGAPLDQTPTAQNERRMRELDPATWEPFEQMEAQIWDEYENNKQVRNEGAGWLVDQYIGLMDAVRQALPGEKAERVARSFGETLNEWLYEYYRQAGMGEGIRPEHFVRLKEAQFGQGQAGVSEEQLKREGTTRDVMSTLLGGSLGNLGSLVLNRSPSGEYEFTNPFEKVKRMIADGRIR